jgi:hypothetical protein
VPHLEELASKHADDGFVLIGVHTTGSAERMPAFVEEQGIDYPVAIDVDKATATAFAVDSYPDYHLIDRSGNLRVADCANAGIDAAVTALLAEPAPADVKPDAEQLFRDALGEAAKTERHVLVHVHGPG